MASKPRPPQKIHSLFPNSPLNRLLRRENPCGCLHFSSFPSLTPAQTYAIPPVITLEICPSSALSSCMDYHGHIEYRRGLPNPKAATPPSAIAVIPPNKHHHPTLYTQPQVYVCWSANWDGPIPPYPGLPPGNRDDLHFPSTFILDGSHGKWDCRAPQCWDNSRPWALLIPSKNCARYQNHPALLSLVDVAIEAFTDDVSSQHAHGVDKPCILVLPSLLFTINLFDSIRAAEAALFKAARGHPFVMWLRSYMYPVPDGKNDEKWLKEREFRHIEEVFGWLGIAQRYVCELIALAKWCHLCWNLMIGQYPTGPVNRRVPMRKDCVGGWVSGAPLQIIWHYQSIGVPLFFIEHCREERFPRGLRKELLPDLYGTTLTQFPEYTNPPAVLIEPLRTILGLIAEPLQTIRDCSRDARWSPFKPPEDWINSPPTTVPVMWFPTIQQTTSQSEGLSERIQALASYNHLSCSFSWYKLMHNIIEYRAKAIQWKDERRFITHPRHAFQPSAALKPVPVPDDEDTLTHFWVERVDGQGFAEVGAAHIHEFKARGFVGWHHKLCKRLVFFYMPRSLDVATEARIAELLKPLEYTGESIPTDIGIDLDHIPCDEPTMETQMPGVRSMERLESGERILVSTRIVEYMDTGGLDDHPAELEGGGFDHRPLSKSNHNSTPSSSRIIGPVRTIKSSAGFVKKIGCTGTRRRGKQKAWDQRDAPSDRRQRLWSRWVKLANYFNCHQDLLNDLEPLPATVPGRHSKLKKPDWAGMQEVAEILCTWIHRNHATAQWLISQHSGEMDCKRKQMWDGALRRLDYREVWNTPQMDMPREDEPTARQEWLQAKERWLLGKP